MKMHLLRLLAIPALCCALPALAQTFINQNTVNSAGGFPYNINTPGSYQLNGNLTVLSFGVNAININVAGVTLDLGGYSIGGPMVCTSTSCNLSSWSLGVNANSAQTVVRNGFVKGFYTCIHNFGGGRTENLTITSCENGIEAQLNVVTHNTVSACLLEGIFARYSTIQGNVTDSNNYGIVAWSSSALENTATRNTLGLYMSQNGQGLFGSNILVENTTDLLQHFSLSQNNNTCSNGPC